MRGIPRQPLPGQAVIHDPLVSGRLDRARRVSATTYLGSLERRRRLQEAALARLGGCAATAMPTLPFSPPRFIDIADPAGHTALNRRVTLMTNPVNVLDLCALTLPVGTDALGLPVGLQLATGRGQDRALLSLATGVERAIGRPADVLGPPPRQA